MVTTSFPIAGDGSEAAGSFVSDLAEELARHMSVRVVAPGFSSAREQWAEGVEVFRYAAPSKPLSTLKPWHPVDMADLLFVLRAGASSTLEAVQAGNAVHILALWALPSGEWARRASRATGVPYSVWTLGSDIWTWGRVPIIRQLLRRVLRQARYCYSDGLKLAEDTARIAERTVEFLPSTRRIAACSDRLPADKPPYRLLFLGRWHPNKGVDLLLDALDLLEPNDWSRIAAVEIHGGGPLGSLVRERVASLRTNGHPVEVGHFLAKEEAIAAIERADWVLIPSRVESIPVVFSDAMKLGRPVISMPVGDLKRLLQQHAAGICSQSISADAFANSIRRALGAATGDYASATAAVAGVFSMERAIVPKMLALQTDKAGGRIATDD